MESDVVNLRCMICYVGSLPANPSGSHDVLGDRPWLRDRLTVFAHTGEVKTNRATNQFGGLSKRRACCDTAGKVRDVGAVTRGGLFEKNCVFHFNPACFRILLWVFGSSHRGMPGDGYAASLDRVLILTVTSFLADQSPAIVLYHPDRVTYLHLWVRARSLLPSAPRASIMPLRASEKWRVSTLPVFR